MPILATGTTFATDTQVTHTNLNAAVNSATFAAGAVDDSTLAISGGAIIVKDAGITAAKLAALDPIDINGGTIDGASIGASSASAGTFTTLSASGTASLSGVTTSGILTASSAIRSDTAIGRTSTTGGSVTQLTSRTTGVTLNKQCGRITTAAASLAALASATFTVNNVFTQSLVQNVFVAVAGGATNKETQVSVTRITSSAFDITVDNRNATTPETGAIQINFVFIWGDT